MGKRACIDLWKNCGASAKSGPSLWQAHCRSGKLRRAFEWLKEHNPYYFGLEWREDAAAAWEAQDVQLGVVREVDDDLGQAFLVSGVCFRRWMQVAGTEAAVGDVGYTIGRRVLHMITEESEDPDPDLWGLVRRAVAEVFGQGVFRVAASLPQEVLAVALSARGHGPRPASGPKRPRRAACATDNQRRRLPS